MSGSPVRIVYSDLDGTMLGPMGSFFTAHDGSPTLEPAQALHDLHQAGIPLVLVSGRTMVQLGEAVRLLGADGYIGEMGGVVAWDHGFRHTTSTGAMPSVFAGRLPAEVIDELGVVPAMQARWPGRVEWHSPWHTGRETDAMVRGRLEIGPVRAWLHDQGWDWLRIFDNGVLPAPGPSPDVESVLEPDCWPPRVYHLMPAGLTKGTGVAADLARRGLQPQDALAIGDSVSDLEMAGHVRELYMVANGAADPEVSARVHRLPNVRVAPRSQGLGWTDAVRQALATRHGP